MIDLYNRALDALQTATADPNWFTQLLYGLGGVTVALLVIVLVGVAFSRR